MKKFYFSLETVLTYKDQVLESLQSEHAALLAKVLQQEEVVDGLWQEYRTCNEEYRERKREGMTIMDAMGYQRGLRALEAEIQRESQRLEEFKQEAEQKREEVVEAKKETSSLEKLKEKKQVDYQKTVQKSEEQLVEEFVSMARVREAGA
jgi:flagellar FliJ protein